MASFVKFCISCGSLLNEPYIVCAECTSPKCWLCPGCFAKGFESGHHENNHSYEVVKNDFTLFEDGWTAQEEVKLLEAVTECGLGNWSDVASQLPKKNKHQCERHYIQHYIENPKPPLQDFAEPDFRNAICSMPIPHRVCQDPPRPTIDSHMYNEMGGYMAGRSDFATEYDNYAENDICNMEFLAEDDEQDVHLKVAILRIYNRRLRERFRRKRILRKYGLIHLRKTVQCLRNYDTTIGRKITENLMCFMRLFKPMEFDLMTECINYECELKQKIRALQEYRKAGLTHFYSTQTYMRLRKKREERRLKPKFLDSVVDHIQNKLACQQWLQRQVLSEAGTGANFTITPPPLHRRPAPPLDIVGLPGFEKLNANEKELCSFVRLVPDAYLEFKRILVNECQKLGSLRLAQARNLIKIDVNKTRKIYDFLVTEGYIKKES